MPIEIPDPLLSFRWRPVALPSFGATLRPEFVMQITLPLPRTDAVPVYGSGKKKYYAGFTETSAISMSVYMDGKVEALKWYNAWRNAVVSKEGVYGMPKDYWKDIDIRFEDTTGAVQQTATLVDAWPLGGTIGGLNRSGPAQVVTFDLDFQVNDIKFS